MTIAASDLAASEAFYRTVLPTLGLDDWREFAPADDGPVTRGLHVGFVSPSRAYVDAFWRAGVEAGYRDDGAPGPRPEYGSTYYGGFLLDPDGNSAEAVHHDETAQRPGAIDHLWLRVADLAASRRFYEELGPRAGFALRREHLDRVQFAGNGGSFSIVAGTPTENARLAFPGGPDSLRDPDGNLVELVA